MDSLWVLQALTSLYQKDISPRISTVLDNPRQVRQKLLVLQPYPPQDPGVVIQQLASVENMSACNLV